MKEEFIKVIATQDESSHWYIVPEGEFKEFSELEEKIIESINACDDKEEDLIDKFEEKFSKYQTGGDLNNTQLYIKK